MYEGLIAFVLVIVFWCWLIYAIASSLSEQVYFTGSILSQCPLGECPTDLVTGEKKCPPLDGTTRYAYDPTVQVCQPAGFCNPGYFAVQNDGSTDIRGYCPYNESGTRQPCRCVRGSYCASYIKAYFSVTNGNVYTDPNSTFAQVQDPAYTSGQIVDDESIGIQIPNTVTSFCTIPIDWIYRTTPGCTFDPSKDPTNALHNNYLNAMECMNENPCNVGILAFIADDASSFTESQVNYYPVGCVPGKICPSNMIPIYDKGYGQVICRQALPE